MRDSNAFIYFPSLEGTKKQTKMDSPQRTKYSRSGASWGSVCTLGIFHISMDLLGLPGVSEFHPPAEELNQQLKQQRSDIPKTHTRLIFCMRIALHREREGS